MEAKSTGRQTMKKLGVLGGMGPLPTIQLFEMIVSMTDASCDQEHVHIIIDNNTKIPDRTAYLLDNNNENPLEELRNSALRLEETGADFIVMPCNTAHYYYEEINEVLNIPFLNMVEESAIWVKNNRPNIKKIGLLATDGTIKIGVYSKVFKEKEIEVISPSKENQRNIYRLIYNLKENKKQGSLEGIYRTMEEFEGEGADVFIAGCTEVSVALNKFNIEGDFIDPMEIIARKAVEISGAKLKKQN